MSQVNPTILSPTTRFKAAGIRSHSRSPSRSPVRKAIFTAHEVDPLLNNLSPDSTLQALSDTDAISAGQKEEDLLSRSISQATRQERALGIRAAIAGKKVREWYRELQEWEWPDRWAGPSKGFEPPRNPQDEEYFGSLPARLLEHYEERIEEIRDGLEALEVEDLKEHVLDAHIPSRSRPGSSDGISPLSDFTAVITATIVQALPYLARLYGLLNTWDARLVVLRLVPGLLRGLKSGERALREAWDLVENDGRPVTFNRDAYIATKATLQHKVSSLGTLFDRVLDCLEGSEDSIPEHWIDQMDNIEMEFANWVIAADKRLFVIGWEAQHSTPTSPIRGTGSRPVTRGSPLSVTEYFDEERKSHAATDQTEVPATSGDKYTATEVPKPEALQIPNGRHRRGVSEVSVAESMLSEAFSDISNAEILNASTAEVSTPVIVEALPRRFSSGDLLTLSQPQPSPTQRPRTMHFFGHEVPWSVPSPTSFGRDDGHDSTPLPDGSVPAKHPVDEIDQSESFQTDDVQERPPQVPRKSSKRLSRTLDSASSMSSPPRPDTAKSAKSKSADETIEEKIQDILTTIPARIHLNSKPPPIVSSTIERASTPTPSLTLTPVRPLRNARPSVSAADSSDVKMYHLSRSNQAKDAPPLKLFVRLVGEDGERVMVRVGGGWADLGEYLREYALHHGHGKSSKGKDRFEVQALPTSRRTSGAIGSSPNGPSRPGSALDFSRPTPGSGSQKPRRTSAASTYRASPASAFSMESEEPVPTISTEYHDSSPLAGRSTTPTSLSSSPALPKYTPLGAAGPVKSLKLLPHSSRPSTASSQASTSAPWSDLNRAESPAPDDGWVQDVMQKARRTQASHLDVPSTERGRNDSNDKARSKSKSRLSSLGFGGNDSEGGIRRVFLKKKSSRT